MKNDVFVSYEHGSKAIADSIVAAFEQDRIRCWYAPRDVIGDYATSIVEAIENTSVFVLVLNGESSNSAHVLNEVEMAYKRNIEQNQSITIMPFKISNDQFSRAMEYYIKRMHWIDATNSPLYNSIENLKSRVKKILGREDIAPSVSAQRSENKFFTADNTKELRRLQAQERILRDFDGELYEDVVNSRKDVYALDLGCNCGDNLYSRFAPLGNIRKVVGIDCDGKSVEQATQNYGSDVFRFYQADVETHDFEKTLDEICREERIEKFDVVNLSMLILHLKKPYALLRVLRKFLVPDGVFIIKDIDDGLNLAYPDKDGLFAKAIQICNFSEFSGYRKSGREIYTMLRKCGFADVKMRNALISTAGMSFDEREALFDVYFSFIREDMRILSKKYPDDDNYVKAAEWFEDNYERLESEFLSEEFFFTLGFMLFTAKR